MQNEQVERRSETVPVYHNPIPVVTLIVPVYQSSGSKFGVVLVRRAIEPFIGELALPGGYIEEGNWREWALRELREETGINFVNKNTVTPFNVESTPDGKKLLIFARTIPTYEMLLKPFIPNDEVSELVIVNEPLELCFSLHTAALKRFFAEQAQNV